MGKRNEKFTQKGCIELDEGFFQKSQVVNPKDIGKVLSWVHIAICNAKTQLVDMHHDIQTEYSSRIPE